MSFQSVSSKAWVMGLMLVVGCRDDVRNPSVTGSGGTPGTGGSSTGGTPGTGGVENGGPGSGGSHGELCTLRATCLDGRVTGTYGVFCSSLDFTCPSGCRTSPAAIPSYRESDSLIAHNLARDALCEPSDGGVLPADALPPDGASTCLPKLVDGRDTGFDTCGDGTIHRRVALECPGLSGTLGAGQCWKDADCAAGAICVCSTSLNTAGQCAAAGCRTEHDCATGQGCIATVRSHSADMCAPAGAITFDCEMPSDACSTNADCGDSAATPRECRLVGDRRVCGCRS